MKRLGNGCPDHLDHGQHADRHVEDEHDEQGEHEGESALLDVIGMEPAGIDEIIERSGLGPGRAAALLMMLEIEGRIRQLDGKRFVQVKLV